jgi:hypothetical protein
LNSSLSFERPVAECGRQDVFPLERYVTPHPLKQSAQHEAKRFRIIYLTAVPDTQKYSGEIGGGAFIGDVLRL